MLHLVHLEVVCASRGVSGVVDDQTVDVHGVLRLGGVPSGLARIEVMRNPPIFGGTAATAARFCSFREKCISADTARIHAVSFFAPMKCVHAQPCSAAMRPGNYYLTGARERALSQSTDVRHRPGGGGFLLT